MVSQAAFDSLDEAFIAILRKLLRDGKPARPRGLPTREIISFAFSLANPRCRYVSVPARRWSFPYALGELCWHMRGSNSLAEIAWYAKKWREVSADGSRIIGSSYGASIFRPGPSGSQWNRIVALLRNDPDSRRAVFYLHTEPENEDIVGVDVGCALTLQFLVRSGRIEAICSMRSNDAMLGLPYDVFFFTMLQERLATELGLGLGQYHHHVGSLHLYDSDADSAKHIVTSGPDCIEEMPAMEGVQDIGLFLAAEAGSRGQYPGTNAAPPQTRYWRELSEVLVQTNSRRMGQPLPSEWSGIENRLYKSLLALR